MPPPPSLMALGENTTGLAMADDVLSDFYNLMPGDLDDEPEEKNVPPMAEVAFDLAASLACPVCFELPAGEVHQCFEGHCYCIDCWRRLQPRRCPECRDPIPLRNRSRAQEARVAALPAVCDHCDQVTTRGAMAEHLRVCQQRPTTCAAAAAGCGLEGMAAGQATAKQPLSGRVRALDEEEEEEVGGRRRRQRVGPAPHDAPPSDATIAVMGMGEATAALREHSTVVRVVEHACMRLRNLIEGGYFSEPLQSQGVKAVVDAMQAHLQVAKLQSIACAALHGLTRAVSIAGRQAAADTGAIEAVLNAMQAHQQNRLAQRMGFDALTSLCYGYDAAVLRAVEAGVLQVAVAAMRMHSQNERMQLSGCFALMRYGKGEANEQRATEAGGRAVVIAAMQAFPKMKTMGQHLLDVLPQWRTAITA